VADDLPALDAFLTRWSSSSAAERANYQLFLSELCDLLEVPRPEPTVAREEDNAYVFEKAVTFHHPDGSSSSGRIDLYRRGCFVLEAKQGSGTDEAEAAPPAALAPKGKAPRGRRGTAVRGTVGWSDAMLAARGQAEQYARALPVAEGWPPFLIVVDVGFSCELYADFTGSGKLYLPFPDPARARIRLAELRSPEVRARLRQVWLDPCGLDPARHSARVTREMAVRLAALARSLEAAGHAPEEVAAFLIRCLFTLFAEDVGLLPARSFTALLAEQRDQPPDGIQRLLTFLWQDMDRGGFSAVLRGPLLRFNGGLFAHQTALPLTKEQLDLLLEAAHADWRDVEPAIFGTLLERALDPRERHRLGAHYTPRAYVERLVLPTVVEPLRDEWASAHAAAVALARAGKLAAAQDEVKAFHDRLCGVRVLDPACGSGNFLYVTLEHLKRLEGEVFQALADFSGGQQQLYTPGHTVDPHQLLGLEINPRAAAIAEAVLWIGYLQWHFRSRGPQVMPPEPVLKAYGNIECRDAVLDSTSPVLRRDEGGVPVTCWDEVTFKVHPVTGKAVPDEAAQQEIWDYPDARPATWPEAEFVVGNPPFVGNKRMRAALGHGYTEALRRIHPDVPATADLVMYWWDEAATACREGRLRRFGLITTNSVHQVFNRGVLARHLDATPASLKLLFAIPDHPWVDAAQGAAVRIAMTVAAAATGPDRDAPSRLGQVVREQPGSDQGETTVALDWQTPDRIHANLTGGADVSRAMPLRANVGLSFQGMNLVGQGFRLTRPEVRALGYDPDTPGALPSVIRPYLNARELTQVPEDRFVIDLFGLTAEEARARHPALYQWLLERVKPERDQNNRPQYRQRWWIFGEPRGKKRPLLRWLQRYIVTPITAKHRFFVWAPLELTPDCELYAICTDDAYLLGVLSARIHKVWALAAGSHLGVGNDPRWRNTRCFDPFPFPVCDEPQQQRIRDLAEQLDLHRKRQQALHPGLTLTGMYNVVEALREGRPLTPKEKVLHEQGLCSVLRQLHDELDLAVAEAYGWPVDLPDEELLERLVALNRERAAEEARGLVRWLRPEFQHPAAAAPAVQLDTELPEAEEGPAPLAPVARRPWPKKLPEQATALRAALAARPGPATPADLAGGFTGARADRVAELLDALVALGQARQLEDGRVVA
jgi:SAM-dependent methyltransferase